MKKYRPHLLVLCVLAIVVLSGMHNALQSAITDLRFGWISRQASGQIALVAIDPPSLNEIGVWPWPRKLHAELIDRLENAGATDIAFDIDFSSSSNPDSDQAFVDALKNAGGSVVLPAFKQATESSGHKNTVYVNRPLPIFGEHAWPAVVNVTIGSDGLVRHYSYGETLDGYFLSSFGAILADKYDTEANPFLIDFSIRTDSLPIISYVDVLRGDPAALKKLKDRKVIIGSTAIELGDRFNVPNGGLIPGPVLQMLAAESIVQGRMLHGSSVFVTLGGLGAMVLLLIWLWSRASAGLRVAVLVGLAITIELCATLLQARFPLVLNTSIWHATIAAYLAAVALDEIDFRKLLGRIADRRFHRIAMSLGDGLVCTDQKGLITVWNPGAAAIFGYQPDEMIGQPFDRIYAVSPGNKEWAPRSILKLPPAELQAANGKVIELEGRRKNGEAFPLEVCFSKWQGVDGLQYGALIRDISVRKREAERIRYLAEHDTLTGLANRNQLQERLASTLGEAKAKHCEAALLMMDLDRFKQINDTMGHACGDQLLRDVAERLKTIVGGKGLVARLSGDEFAAVIDGADAVARAKELSERISLAFAQLPFSIGTRELCVNVSIGVAVYPKDSETAGELLVAADLALYQAKAAGRGRHAFFEPRFRNDLELRLLLEDELGQAVKEKQFEIFYQPQINLADGRLMGAEALIRWRHPGRGLVLPDDFMPVANTSSNSDDIARWVMRDVCTQGSLWQRQRHNVRLAVNLSPSQFQSGDLVPTIEFILKSTGFSSSLLELEVTESILLEDDERALDIFRRLQGLGVRIAFDDFGTGYASMTYLKKFPLNKLKIDKSFVGKLRENSDDLAIVGATITLGKLLGLSVIAEGIEDKATADLLSNRGCEEGQGYYFGRPMPAEEFERKFLSKGAVEMPEKSVPVRATNAA